MQRAAIYCRVSTARQNTDDKVSMEDQEERCRAVCATKGWDVVGLYDEGDASAGTAQRGEFQRLIADAKAGLFDVIVAREVSRLSRVSQARHAIETLMVDWGLAVCNARTGLVYSESEGLGAGVIWTLEARLAEAELAEKSFRTTMGKNGKAAQGKYPSGRAPYGYRWSGGEHSELVIHEAQSAIVRRVFELAAAGRQCPEIVRLFTETGVPTPGGGRRWATSSIHAMIKDRCYTGDHEYGRLHYRKLNSERDRQAWAAEGSKRTGRPTREAPIPSRVAEERPAGDPNRYAVAVPPIVDRDLFDRANRVVARTKRNRETRLPQRQMLLQGLFRCEACGQHMKITWAEKPNGAVFYFYRCGTHGKDRARLPCRTADRATGRKSYVSAPAVEGAVWRIVDGMLSQPETLAAAIGARLAEESSLGPQQDERIHRHEQRLAKAERTWDVARRAYFAGDLEPATYERDREHYEGEIRMLREELERMRQANEERRRQSATSTEIYALAQRWGEVWDTLNDGERREILWAIVSDVTISPDDALMVSGTLSGLAGWTEKESGSPAGIRTPNLSVNSRTLYR